MIHVYKCMSLVLASSWYEEVINLEGQSAILQIDIYDNTIPCSINTTRQSVPSNSESSLELIGVDGTLCLLHTHYALCV